MAEETQQSAATIGGYTPVDTNAAYEQVTALKPGGQWKHDWFVLRSLVSKDFKLKYRRSVLGILWSVLNPLLMMAVLAIVFTQIFKFDVGGPFPVYLILGNILFDYMSRGTTGAMSSIIEAQSLIKKVRINKMIFPIEKVAFELVNFAISLVAAAAVMAVFQVVPSVHVLWGLPFLLIVVTIFASGLGLLISALSVFFRDVMHLWGVLIIAWTYFTPLFYPVSILPPEVMAVMNFNPMYHYVSFFRDIMMWNVNPGGFECLLCLGMAVGTFIVGLLVFRKMQNKFILYI